MSFYLALVALGVTGAIGIASQFNRGRYFLSRFHKLVFIVVIVTFFSLVGYFAFEKYQSWLQDPLFKFSLPPYQDFGYFFSYAFINFFLSYIISFGAALLFLIVTTKLNKKFKGKFFEKEEPYLGAISLFLTGHPGWLIYIVVLISAYFILHTSYFIQRRETVRLPLYRLWASVAFFVILMSIILGRLLPDPLLYLLWHG